MEDENELPFLVYEKRDDIPRGKSQLEDINFKDVPFREFSSYVSRLRMTADEKANLVNSVEIQPEDCTFSMHQGDDGIRIVFKIKNEYCSLTLTVEYDRNSGMIKSQGGYSDHDGLESMQWFKDAVHKKEKEKGYRFIFCYVERCFSTSEGKLLIKDDCETFVMFEKDGVDDHYGYSVDFARKSLKFYHEYPFFEFYEMF